MQEREFWKTLGVILIVIISACSSEPDDPEVDCGISTLTLAIDNLVDSDCGLNNGVILVSASGGSGTYSYSLSGAGENTSGSFTDLAAGGYTVMVNDGSCSKEVATIVNNVEGVAINNIDIQESGCGESNGVLTVEAAAGVPPYEYSINNGPVQNENVFDGLEQGSYIVRVADSQDCEITQEVAVLSGISWENEVAGIISSNCAVPSCHGGTQLPDFREFTNVQDNAARIRERTQNGSMPPNTILPAVDVVAIACWVDDGAQDN